MEIISHCFSLVYSRTLIKQKRIKYNIESNRIESKEILVRRHEADFRISTNRISITAPVALVIQDYLGVLVQGPSPNFRNNIQNSNYKFQKFLCSQYFIIQHFVLQIILYFLSQLESKLMTLIDKKISIAFESVNISTLGKVKKHKLFEIQLLRLFYLHKV